MSRWQGVRLVAGRELREALRRKTFWIIVGVLLVASTAGVVLPEVLGGDRTSYDVAVVAGDAPTVIAKQDRADSFVATAQQAVGVQALADRLEAEGLSRDEVGRALAESTARVVRLDEDEASRQGSAAIVSTVLYLLLLMLTIAVANGTAIEKANRISEVLLAIVRPGALLFVLVAGLLVAQSASDSPVGRALALFPFTSPMVMPSRIAVGAASGAEMALSLGLGLATVALALRVGSRIYARAIVRTGRRIKLREALA